MTQERVDPEVVRAALDRVLTREGIPTPPPEPGLIETWLSDLLSGLFGSLDGANVTRPILIGLGAFLVALTLALVYSRWRARVRRPSRTAAEQAERRARARDLHERARRAEAEDDLALALRLALFALVVALGEEGSLEFHAGWTDRELLERGRPPEQVRARLAQVLDELEPKTFGHVPALAEDLRRLEALTRELAPEVAA